MKFFLVGVLQDDGSRERKYNVAATTADDALQLGFAIDGGNGTYDGSVPVQDRSDTLELAKSYSRII